MAEHTKLENGLLYNFQTLVIWTSQFLSRVFFTLQVALTQSLNQTLEMIENFVEALPTLGKFSPIAADFVHDSLTRSSRWLGWTPSPTTFAKRIGLPATSISTFDFIILGGKLKKNHHPSLLLQQDPILVLGHL